MLNSAGSSRIFDGNVSYFVAKEKLGGLNSIAFVAAWNFGEIELHVIDS